MTIKIIQFLCISAVVAVAPNSFAQSQNWDEDAIPIKRIPPIMPSDIRGSGYCCMAFQVNKAGRPENIKADYCTDTSLRTPSQDAISKWKYTPAKRNGQATTRFGIKAMMSFALVDERGIFIPSRTGYLDLKSSYEDTPNPPPGGDAYKVWMETYFFTQKPCGSLIS